MAQFQTGGPGGPGRPRSDRDTKRVREIIQEKLTPALPAILDRLLGSNQPRIILESLKVLLPYVAARQSSVDLRVEQQEGLVERTLMEIYEERQKRAAAAAAASEQSVNSAGGSQQATQ